MTTTSQIGSEAVPGAPPGATCGARCRRHTASRKVSPTRARPPTDLDDEGSFGVSRRRARSSRRPAALDFGPVAVPAPPLRALALAGPSTRAKVRRRQNSSSGQLEYHLDKVDGMKKMRAKVVPPKQKPADEPAARKTKARPEPANGAGGGKPASGKKGASGERHAAEEAARQLSKSDLDRGDVTRRVYKSLPESYKPARPGLSKSAAKCKGSDRIDCCRQGAPRHEAVREDVRPGRGAPGLAPAGEETHRERRHAGDGHRGHRLAQPRAEGERHGRRRRRQKVEELPRSWPRTSSVEGRSRLPR